MLSERGASYIIHQHLSSGKTLEYIADRWAKTYPDDTFTVAEAAAFLKEVQRLRDGGMRAAASVVAAREGKPAPPKLTVASAKKASKKTPKKGGK
uniref:Uncharacterized protein n=1 Tax=viral metagenome TaxID=1070528 RepID=A0A6M3KYC8_9ZZZZ